MESDVPRSPWRWSGTWMNGALAVFFLIAGSAWWVVSYLGTVCCACLVLWVDSGRRLPLR